MFYNTYSRVQYAHREIFSESGSITPKSDHIYHLREIWKQTELRLKPNQSEKGNDNQMLVSINATEEKHITNIRVIISRNNFNYYMIYY